MAMHLSPAVVTAFVLLGIWSVVGSVTGAGDGTIQQQAASAGVAPQRREADADAGDSIVEYNSSQDLVQAISRSDVYTVVFIAARWDGWWKAFRPTLNQVADILRDEDGVEVGLYMYSGSRDSKQIPPETGLKYTLPSFDVFAFRNGIRVDIETTKRHTFYNLPPDRLAQEISSAISSHKSTIAGGEGVDTGERVCVDGEGSLPSVTEAGNSPSVRPQRTCLKEYTSQEALVDAIARNSVYTVVAIGAPWDNYWKIFRSIWEEVASRVCDIEGVEVGIYEYSGARDSKQIPAATGLPYTLGSYEVYAFKDGEQSRIFVRDISSYTMSRDERARAVEQHFRSLFSHPSNS